MIKNKAWLPNAVTLTNLILGFYAIILIIREQFVIAAFLIFVGMVLDGLDGRLARKLTGDNPMGKELDSLADLISFGVTPALLIYQMHLTEYAILGVVAVTFVPVCGAIRLARFNAIDSETSGDHFVGLPITAAGGFLIAFVLAGVVMPALVYIPLVLLVGLLMISRIKYPNFKRMTAFQLKFLVVFFVVCLALALTNPSAMLMHMLIGYVSLGLGLHMVPMPGLVKLFYSS